MIRPTHTVDAPDRLKWSYPQLRAQDLFLIPDVPVLGLDLSCITERCINTDNLVIERVYQQYHEYKSETKHDTADA